LVEPRVGAQLAREVAVLGHLDLDHLGAQQGELIGAQRPRQNVGEVQHADAGKRLRHVNAG
jgi:hypothetical protein